MDSTNALDKDAEKTCFICNKVGHIARNCPDKDNAPEGAEK